MHPYLKSGLAVLAGIFVGGIANFGIIILSSSIIPHQMVWMFQILKG